MILSMIGFSTGGSAPVLHAVLLRKFAFNLGFQKNHGTLQKQMRVSENGQEAKGDMAWEEEWTCDCEQQYPVPAEKMLEAYCPMHPAGYPAAQGKSVQKGF